MGLAMQLIFTPMILRLIDRSGAPDRPYERPSRRTDERPESLADPRRAARERANALRFLAIDAVNAAKSGHPGMPMAWPTSPRCSGAST